MLPYRNCQYRIILCHHIFPFSYLHIFVLFERTDREKLRLRHFVSILNIILVLRFIFLLLERSNKNIAFPRVGMESTTATFTARRDAAS